jgi:hypothetical protein
VNGQGGFVALGVFVALALLIPAGILAYEAGAIPGWLGFAPVALGAAAVGFGVWLARRSET